MDEIATLSMPTEKKGIEKSPFLIPNLSIE